ncbi:MAG: hypothetical protein K0R67_3579 [Paenibacillus sp.]|jgi:uncharacterized protein YdaT|nr:hypothetical protein [Paenibacillus sp.]
MPWTKGDYPPSMKNMEVRTRNKAIEIANALLEDGYEEGRAIAIATAQAKEWSSDHPDHSGDHAVNKHSQLESNIHVVPNDDEWVVKEEGQDKPLYRSGTKATAVEKAQKLASDNNKSAIVHRKDGTVEHSYNYR